MSEERIVGVDTLSAGRELDALVAEKVMGWCRSPDPHQHSWGEYRDTNKGLIWCSIQGRCEPDYDVTPWHPSTEIAAAWEIVEKLLPEQGFALVYLDARWPSPKWRADFAQGIGEAATAPLAICLAALKAVASTAPSGQTPI